MGFKLSLSFIAGLAVAFLCVYLIGFTAAIAYPDWYVTLFNARENKMFSQLLWNIVVLHGLGIGVLTGIVGYRLMKKFPQDAAIIAISFGTGIWCFAFLLAPLVWEYPFTIFDRYWVDYSFELVLVGVLGSLVWWFSRQSRPSD
ncbi:MAG: hypothetical protein ACWA5Q_08315 [bacterium]